MQTIVILFLIWNVAFQSAIGFPQVERWIGDDSNNSSTAAVITYGAPLQATDIDGFDVLTSDGGTQTFASGFAMTTRLPETVGGLAASEDGSYIVIFGDFTVWNSTRVGNILKFVPATGTWTTMGSGVSGVRIDDVIIVNNAVIMVGHFQAFAANPNTNVYNVGQCDPTGESCSSLGSGILDYADAGFLEAVNNNIYLTYESDEGRACVISYYPLNSGAKQWTNLVRDPDPNCWIRLATVGENLYALGNFTLPGLSNLVSFASYDGTLWTVLLEGGLLPITYKEYPSVGFVEYQDTLFFSKISSDNFTTEIYYWNGKEFGLHFSTFCNGTLATWLSGGDYLLLGCNKTILNVNPWISDFSVVPEMTCNTEYNHFLTVDDYLYALCFPNEYVLQMQTFNTQTETRQQTSNITNIASVELHLRAMCALNEQLFIGGLFTLVDNVATPFGAAMWDGYGWVNIFFTNSSDIWIRCATDSESILLVGIVDWYDSYRLKMAQYMGESKFAVYSSNFTQVLDVSTIAINSNYSYMAIRNQAGYTQIVAWNIMSKAFSLLLQLDGSYNETNIRTLAADDSYLYIGGDFHWVFDNIAYLNIAKYNLNTSAWEFIGWIGNLGELDFVDSIVITPQTIYAAGSFSTVAGLNYVQNIAGASVNGTWVTNLNGGLPGVLDSLQFDGQKLYFIQLRFECQSSIRLSTCTNLFAYDTVKHTTSLSLKVGVASIAVSFIEPSNILPGESSSAPLNWELYGIIAGCVFGFIIVSLVVVYWYRKIKMIWKYQDIPEFVRAWGGSGEEEIDFQNEDFELKNVLGRGSFGTVWSCVLPNRNGASFAVKQMLISLGDKERIEMVENEIQVLQKLRHKNIVHFVGYKKLVSKTSMEFFLFMELFEKPCSLKGVIQKKQSRQAKYGYPEWFSFEEVKKFITQMAEGLEYLHQNRIAHRDLKTANILVRTQTSLKVRSVHIADFGLATDATVHAMASTVTGTPCYMAPEVLNKEKYDPFKADIWSFGIVVYEILTWREPSVVGKRPEFPPDRVFNDERFAGILELFESCTELKPADRPTASEILQMCNYLQF